VTEKKVKWDSGNKNFAQQRAKKWRGCFKVKVFSTKLANGEAVSSTPLLMHKRWQ